jgi:hypothetical protein
VKIREGIEGDWRGRERRGEEDKKEEEGQLFKGKHYGEAKQERVSEWVVSPPPLQSKEIPSYFTTRDLPILRGQTCHRYYLS